MTEAEIIKKLKKNLKPARFDHTIGVAETAVRLSERYGADVKKAYLAALLHDSAKNLPEEELSALYRKYLPEGDTLPLSEPALLHAYVGAHLARDEYGEKDPEIFDAVFYHTTGKENMSLLCKIIFLADIIEPTRKDFPGLSLLRARAEENLDSAVLTALEMSINHVIKKGGLLHPDTVKARNCLKGYKNGNN